MTRLFNGMWLGLFAVAMVGCQSGSGNSADAGLAEVPPPVYEEDFEPVEVEARQPGAVAPQQQPPTLELGGPAPAPATRTYTVQRGDTLWSIAQRLYGDGQRWVDIARANPTVDPQKMAVGQSLVLP